MKLAKQSFVFASGTVLSRLSGLIRDQVILAVFGASAALDAFFLAFRIPNLFREMLAEGALGSAFTKVYSQLKAEDLAKAQTLLAQMLRLTLLLAVLIAVCGVILAPVFVELMTWKGPYGPARTSFVHEAVGLTRLLFPFLGFAIMGAIAAGALHEKGRFFTTAVAPMAFNLCYILGALVFASLLPELLPPWWAVWVCDPALTGLALGVLLGGAAQMLVQMLQLKQELSKLDLPWRLQLSPEVKQVFILMGPAAIAASAGPINLMINTNFAASVGPGAISWLVTAMRLLQLPVGVFAVAIGVVILPELTRSIGRGKSISDQTRKLLGDGLMLVIAILAPCAVFLFAAAEPLITLLFEYGKFTRADTLQVAAALQAYAFAVISYGLIKVLTAFYYAIDKTTVAMKVSLLCVAVNFCGNWLLVDHFGHVGLAWTTAITLGCNVLLLLIALRGYKVNDVYKIFAKTLALAAAISAIAFGAQSLALDMINLNHFAQDAHTVTLALAKVILIGITILFSYGALAGVVFARQLKALLHKRRGHWS